MSNFISTRRLTFYIFLLSSLYFLWFSRYGIDIDDEGFHLYVSGMILKGLVPYRDFIVHATPGSFYLQAFIFKVLTPSVFVGRVSVVLLGVYIAMMLLKINRSLVSSAYFASISSILFIFWGVSHIRHPWYGWYGLASGLTFVYLCLKDIAQRRTWPIFFAGLLCTLTFMMKQNLGIACLASYILFLTVDSLFSRGGIKEKACSFLKRGFIFIAGILSGSIPISLYFFSKKAFPEFLYYAFKFAMLSAKKRLIFNPYPHIKLPSIFILCIFLLFAWLLHGYFWSRKKKVFLFLVFCFMGALIAGGALFIFKINELDGIYILDHIKMGAVNGFFNIAALSMLVSIGIVLKAVLRKEYSEPQKKALLFIALFSLFYSWASLCISRDFLHLILGMPPLYVLISFMVFKGTGKLRSLLIKRGKHDLEADRFSKLTLCVSPLLFFIYFGFLTALKNEGFRSVAPPITNMHSRLEIKHGNGIMVTERDKRMIENIVTYINDNTDKDERIFDTYKSLLFYFLSGRMHPSFYYVLHYDLFRPDRQEDVIRDIARHDINLVITEKDKWDNRGYYIDSGNNPLTYRIWQYIVNNYGQEKHFDKYYILAKDKKEL